MYNFYIKSKLVTRFSINDTFSGRKILMKLSEKLDENGKYSKVLVHELTFLQGCCLHTKRQIEASRNAGPMRLTQPALKRILRFRCCPFNLHASEVKQETQRNRQVYSARFKRPCGILSAVNRCRVGYTLLFFVE